MNALSFSSTRERATGLRDAGAPRTKEIGLGSCEHQPRHVNDQAAEPEDQ